MSPVVSGPFDRKSLFVVSRDLFNNPIGWGPVVAKVEACMWGSTGHQKVGASLEKSVALIFAPARHLGRPAFGTDR